MDDTGRIKKTIDPVLQSIIFKKPDRKVLLTELGYIAEVDQAHVLMLLKCGLINQADSSKLLAEIEYLLRSDFEPLKDVHPVRGLYLMYENYLIEKLGISIGGMLQTGRSRNDLSATITKMKTRTELFSIIKAALNLIESLEIRAKKDGDAVLPGYTHYQPAFPITLAHYFNGISYALVRDIQALLVIEGMLSVSPLGAGAGGGTSISIDPTYTASLLGFSSSASNSIDAIASRDYILRVLSSSAIMGLTLSRLAADLQLWSTHEFGFIRFPDELVGSSSMMPQKRNPFLLEHVKGRSGAPAAAFQLALLAMHATPYGNSVAVGTEAIKGFDLAMEETRSALLILERHIAVLEINSERMLQAAIDGNVCATNLAEYLVLNEGYDFRSAHHQIGEKITDAESEGMNGVHMAAEYLCKKLTKDECREKFSPKNIVASTMFGGGPGHTGWSNERRCFNETLVELRTKLTKTINRCNKSNKTRQLLVKKTIETVAQ